jgi:hypothetical protein
MGTNVDHLKRARTSIVEVTRRIHLSGEGWTRRPRIFEVAASRECSECLGEHVFEGAA